MVKNFESVTGWPITPLAVSLCHELRKDRLPLNILRGIGSLKEKPCVNRGVQTDEQIRYCYAISLSIVLFNDSNCYKFIDYWRVCVCCCLFMTSYDVPAMTHLIMVIVLNSRRIIAWHNSQELLLRGIGERVECDYNNYYTISLTLQLLY